MHHEAIFPRIMIGIMSLVAVRAETRVWGRRGEVGEWMKLFCNSNVRDWSCLSGVESGILALTYTRTPTHTFKSHFLAHISLPCFLLPIRFDFLALFLNSLPRFHHHPPYVSHTLISLFLVLISFSFLSHFNFLALTLNELLLSLNFHFLTLTLVNSLPSCISLFIIFFSLSHFHNLDLHP